MTDERDPETSSQKLAVSVQCGCGDHEQCPDEIQPQCACFCHRLVLDDAEQR